MFEPVTICVCVELNSPNKLVNTGAFVPDVPAVPEEPFTP